MPNPKGNPEWKPKYGEPTKVVRLPESLAEQVTALLRLGVPTSEVLRQLESVPLLHRSQLPEVAAIYLVYQGERLLYIGRTGNLKQRWTQHHRRKQFAEIENVRIAWFPCTENGPAIESTLIDLLEPEFNGQEGSQLNTRNHRVTSYVSPDNQTKLQEFMEARSLSESKAIDVILSEFFSGGIPSAPSSTPIQLAGEALERIATLERQMAAMAETVGESVA